MEIVKTKKPLKKRLEFLSSSRLTFLIEKGIVDRIHSLNKETIKEIVLYGEHSLIIQEELNKKYNLYSRIGEFREDSGIVDNIWHLNIDDLIHLTIFAEIYINDAVNLVKNEKSSYLNSFDVAIRSSIVGKLGISLEEVLYLHHAFHWEFFDIREGIFNYVQSKEIGKESNVVLFEHFDDKKIDSFINSFLEKYVFDNKSIKPYLVARYELIKNKL